MMTQWRVVSNLEARLQDGTTTTVGKAFLDAHKMPIAARLREWDVDIRDIPLRLELASWNAATTGPTGILFINPLARVFQDDRRGVAYYLVLSHELSHFLQFLEGRVDQRAYELGWGSLHEWVSFEHERDAIRWSARQAKAMHISEKEFNRIESDPLKSIEMDIQRIAHPVFTGEFPEERGVRPLPGVAAGPRPRQPVKVRPHLRKFTQTFLERRPRRRR